MRQFVNLLPLAGDFCIADGAVDNLVVAAFLGAGGGNLVLLHHLGGRMRQLFNGNGIAGELSFADSAVNDIVVAAFCRAAGIHLVLLHRLGGRMRHNRNRLIHTGKLCIADGAVDNLVIAAFCRAAGIHLVLLHRLSGSMRHNRNRLGLTGELCVANGAVDNLVVAAFCRTAGIHLVLLHRLSGSVRHNRNNLSIAGELGITDGAIDNIVVATGLGAGCIHLVLLNCRSRRMAQLAVYIRTGMLFGAALALRSLGAILGAGGIVVGNVILEEMIQRIHIFGVAVAGIILTGKGLDTGTGAGRLLCNHTFIIMSKFVHIVIHIGVAGGANSALGAGVSGVTLCLAGGFGHDLIVGMAGSLDGLGCHGGLGIALRILEHLAAILTGVVSIVAVSHAGCSLGGGHLGGMAGSGNRNARQDLSAGNILEEIAAGRAGVVLNVASFCAGGILSLHLGCGVGSLGQLGHIGSGTTHGAGLCLFTLSLTGGLLGNNGLAPGMGNDGNHGTNDFLPTTTAECRTCVTGSSTSGIHLIFIEPSVAQFRNFCSVAMTFRILCADSAGVCHDTGFGTSRLLGLNTFIVAVTQSIHILGVAVALGFGGAAVILAGIGLDALVYAGGIGGNNTFIVLMVQSTDVGIGVRIVTAVLASMSGVALFQTGGRRYLFLIHMIQLCQSLGCHSRAFNAFFILKGIAAAVASPVLLVAGSQTGSGLVLMMGHIVAQSTVLIGASIRDSAAVALGSLRAILRAGGIIVGNVIGKAVAKLVDGLRIGMRRIVLAGIGSDAGAGAGGGGSNLADIVMVKGIDSFLRIQNLAADSALLALGQTSCSTGRCLSRDGFLGMRQLSNGLLLAGELSITDGTIDNLIIAAGLRAGGGNFVLHDRFTLGVRQFVYRNSIAGELSIADSAVNNIVIAAGLRAGGIHLVLHDHFTLGVGQFIYRNSIAGELGITDSAVNNIVIAAGLRAGGIHLVLYDYFALGVRQFVYGNGIAGELNIADGAVDDLIVAAGLRAGGGNFIFLHSRCCLMARGFHFSLRDQSHAAAVTLATFGQSGFGAGGRLSGNHNRIMTQRIYILRCNNYVTADGALLALRQTAGRAGGGHSGDGFLGMQQLSNGLLLAGELSIADGAIDNLIIAAGDLTGGGNFILYDRLIRRVIRHGNHLLFSDHIAADGALLAIGQAGGGAGCSRAGNSLLGMCCHGDYFLRNDHMVADGALLALRQAGGGAGCSLAGDSLLGMRCHGEHFLRNDHMAADGALLALRQTGGGAGGCHSGNSLLGMRCHGNGLRHTGDFLVGIIAMLVGAIDNLVIAAGCSTGSVLPVFFHGRGRRMAGCFNVSFFCFTASFAEEFAGTLFYAGGFLPHSCNLFPGMAQGIHSLGLAGKLNIADGAIDNLVIAAGRGASGGN